MKEQNPGRRRKRLRALFSSFTESRWMDEGHVLFLSTFRRTMNQSVAVDVIKEWFDCGLMQMLMKTLSKIAGKGSLAPTWEQVRLIFISHQKDEESLFACLDEPTFQLLLSFLKGKKHDRSHLDQEWLSNDQNAFCPFHILKALGTFAMVDELDDYKMKLWETDWLSAVRPFLFGAMTTLETGEAARFITNMNWANSVDVRSKMTKIWREDPALVRRMEYLCFEGYKLFYRDIACCFGRQDQPYYFYDILNPSGDEGNERKRLNEIIQQISSAGYFFFGEWMAPSLAPILIKETTFLQRVVENQLLIPPTNEYNEKTMFVMEEIYLSGRETFRDAIESVPGLFEWLLDSAESLHPHQFGYGVLLWEFLLSLPASHPRADELYFRCLPFLEGPVTDFVATVKSMGVYSALDALLAYEKRPDVPHRFAHEWRDRLRREKDALAPAVCAQCRKEGGKLLFCSRCKTVRYCGAACQRLHYKSHKPNCSADAAQKRYQYQGDWNDAGQLDEALATCPLAFYEARSKLLLARFAVEVKSGRSNVQFLVKLFVSGRWALISDKSIPKEYIGMALDGGAFASRPYARLLLHWQCCEDYENDFLPRLDEFGAKVWLDVCEEEYGPVRQLNRSGRDAPSAYAGVTTEDLLGLDDF
jgi:hypothetical protein